MELPKFYLNHLYRTVLALGYLAISFKLSFLFVLYLIEPLDFGITKVMMYASVSLLEFFNILFVVRFAAADLLRGTSC